jgi:negative regulator of flagellin synthesis FlgM
MSISSVTASDRLQATRATAALRANAYRPSTPSLTRQADTVNLSDSARSLASAIKNVGGAPEVREDRVAAIKAALAAGTYTVSSGDLATSLLGAL